MSDYYKVLGYHNECVNGGRDYWHPHVWNEVDPPLKPCHHGLHVCTIMQLPHWLGPTVWNVEIDYDYEVMHEPDKSVVSRARITTETLWSPEVAYRFAMDAIQHVDPHILNAINKTSERWPVVNFVRHYETKHSDAIDGIVPLLRECRKIVCISQQPVEYRYLPMTTEGRDYELWDMSQRAEKHWQSHRLFEYLMHGMATPQREEFTP